MKTKVTLFIVITAVILTACVSTRQKEKTISISGAFALYPMVVKWAEEYKKEHPEVRFNISAGGAGKGMTDALAGTVDLGMFSREITQEEKNQGVWWVSLTIDAVVPTISADNSYLESLKTQGMTREEFKRVFIDGETTNWSDLLSMTGKKNNQKIMVYTRSDACGAAETWAKYLGGNQENLKGVGIFGDPGLADAVTKDPVSIGFNNTIYAYDIKSGQKRPGIEIVPIDINGNGTIDKEEDFYNTHEALLKAIADGYFPSPPARELYFVSKGKPVKKSTLDFIKWTLTRGQNFVKEAGYVSLTQEKITNELNKLN